MLSLTSSTRPFAIRTSIADINARLKDRYKFVLVSHGSSGDPFDRDSEYAPRQEIGERYAEAATLGNEEPHQATERGARIGQRLAMDVANLPGHQHRRAGRAGAARYFART